MNNSRGYSRTCNPIARLKEWFNIGQPSKNSLTNQNKQRFCSQSRNRSNSHQRSYSSSKPDHNDNILFSSYSQPSGQTNSSHRPNDFSQMLIDDNSYVPPNITHSSQPSLPLIPSGNAFPLPLIPVSSYAPISPPRTSPTTNICYW
ncbi:hypothetical protein RhiirC2_789473 [Rhizophagus irregularis]|uniref:Uncharacterized protein n=1 Tax=Rhizophagus irregularis TaxID=588596 RepID=A0A2N1MN66_9GLOM|nr:hypothetical protein RhiirC2_789473 [Rhizophagus irregularis]